MSIFKGMFGKSKGKALTVKKQERDPVRYDRERVKAQSDNAKDRLALAKNPDTHLEILYYLADDRDEKVRRAVAANPSTPVHVSEALAKDNDVDVKIALIKRLTALLPDLSSDQYAHLYAFAANAMGILALDEVLKVRLALSTALRDEIYAPPKVAATLAKDLERQVSEPILKLCAAVPDEILIQILSQHPEPWVVEAIAGRKDLAEGVSLAVIETNQAKAGKILIQNKTANISDQSVDDILARAPEKPEWHKPLALQSHLPGRVMRDIIMYVDRSIQKLILNRDDIAPDEKEFLQDTVKRRMNFLIDANGNRIDPIEKVKQMGANGTLNDDAVCDALALREYDFVYAALTFLSKIKMPVVKKMVDNGAAKSTTSIVWKAGLSMRTALEVQKQLAKVPHQELLYPKNGTDFPLSTKDMQWQVDFYSD